MTFVGKTRRLIVLAVAAALLLSHTFIASAGAGSYQISIQGCQIVFNFVMPPNGQNPTNTVSARLYDLGVLLQEETVTGAVGASLTVYFTIDQLYLDEDVGVGVWDPVLDNPIFGDGGFVITDETAQACIAVAQTAPACPYPAAPLLGQGRVIAPVTTYFAPSTNAATNPQVVLPVGTSWWILEARDGFYKLFIACQGQYLWVPAEALGANFDVVWNGAPLPDAGTQESPSN